MKITLQSLFVLLISLSLLSCVDSSDTAGLKTFDVPELLDRSEKIRLGLEWDNVQNQYGTLKKNILENSNDHLSQLKLAEIFIREARVTGEHGHYYPAALMLTQNIIDTTDDKDLLFQALVTKAGVQLSLHEFKSALETAKKALVINSQSAQIYGVLTDCYVELGMYDKAVKASDKMVRIKPDIRSYSRVSYLREIYGDVKGAKEALNMAVKSGVPAYEETAWAMLTLGDLYNQYGDLETAEKIYSEITDIRKDYPFAIAALADVYHQQNKLDKVEPTLKEAISIIPEVGFYLQLAELYKEQGRNEELKAIMDEVFIMLKDDEQSGHNMNLEYAQLYLNILENTDKALEYAKIEFAKRPKNIAVNLLLCEIYSSRSETEKAEEHCLLASVTNTQNPKLQKLSQLLESK